MPVGKGGGLYTPGPCEPTLPAFASHAAATPVPRGGRGPRHDDGALSSRYPTIRPGMSTPVVSMLFLNSIV